MRWNDTAALVILAGLFVAAGTGSAAAEPARRCAPVAVATDANVRRRWPDLPDQIQRAFEQRDDVDGCARIDITITGPAVVLKVTLPDGRTAARSGLRREDVLPALEALLLLPESVPAAAPPAPLVTTPPSGTPVKPVHAQPPARIAAVLTIPPAEAPGAPAVRGPSLRIDLGLAVEGRAGDGQMGAGIGLASFLELAHWLVGFQARIDRYQRITDRASAMGGSGSVMPGAGGSMALEVDALFGRRFELGASALDLCAGPALALHGSETVATSSSSGTSSPPPADEQGLPRLLVSSRLTFRAHAALRTFIQLDGEIGRSHSSTDQIPDQADLPTWTVGLALGAMVGTR